MMNIENFMEYIPQQLLNIAQQYLLKGNSISILENDEGCYDAVIREGDTEHWVEVTLALGTSNIIEDCYCSKCNSLFCVHTVAVLQLISDNRKMDTHSFSNIEIPVN